MKQPQVVASVLGADYACLGDEVGDLCDAGVARIQWDIMDRHFVPNLTFGADIVSACRERSRVPFEAHLMVQDPDSMLADFASAGCETIIVHVETATHLHRTLSAIQDLGVQAGVALNPSTPLHSVRHVLDRLDQILIMTVNPGFGGQSYISAMEGKISEARELVDRAELPILIEVDGGITPDTAGAASHAGAELLVAGSAVLTHADGKRIAVAEIHQAMANPLPSA